MRPTPLVAAGALALLGPIGMAVPAAASQALVHPGASTPLSDSPSSEHVQHWGSFTGDNLSADQDTTLSPAAVYIPDRSRVIEVGSSNSTQYALLFDGTLWAWGQGTNGQLGDGQDHNSFAAAVRVHFPRGVSIAYIPTDAMPFDTGLAVDTHGHAWGWGLNGSGELCLGNTKSHRTPVELPFRDVTTLAGASGHDVYDARGVVYACGGNGSGTLGTGSFEKSGTHVPVRVKYLNGRLVTHLVASYHNAGALLANGEFYDWGMNTEGQLGVGAIGGASALPVRAHLPGYSPVVQVAEGGSTPDNGQTVVMLANGALYAWGDNSYSQLDDGGPPAQGAPTKFRAPAGVIYAALASGGSTCYAISTAGHVYAWGQNNYGQVGDGGAKTATAPVRVASGASVISATARDAVVG